MNSKELIEALKALPDNQQELEVIFEHREHEEDEVDASFTIDTVIVDKDRLGINDIPFVRIVSIGEIDP